jgi:hypothetical protein
VVSPVRIALTGWLVVPEPTDWAGVLEGEARFGSVPHSNQAFVARPFAVTLPFRVDVVVPTDVAATVVTAGALPGDEVVKLVMELSVPPLSLNARTRK